MIVVIFSNQLAKKAGVPNPLTKNDMERFVELDNINQFNPNRYNANGFELIFIDDSQSLNISDLLRGFKRVEKKMVFFLHASMVNYSINGSKKDFGSNSHFEISFDKRSKLDEILKISEKNILEVIFFKHESSCLVFPDLGKIIEKYNENCENVLSEIEYLTNKFSTAKRMGLISNVIESVQMKNNNISEILRDCKNYNL